MFIVRPMVWRELLRESCHRTHFAGRAFITIVLGAIVLAIGLSLGGSALGPRPVTASLVYSVGGPPRPARLAPGYRPASSYRGRPAPPPMMFVPPPPMAIASVQANMARLGTWLFTLWAVGQYVALCALGTIRAASLAEERRRDRLPLLTITGLGGRGVILGAYASILARALFTMLLLLPILALARGFGGFTTGQACLAAGIGFIAAANAAALTLALASLVSGTAAAVVLSVIVQAILLAVFHFWLILSVYSNQAPYFRIPGILIHSLSLLTKVVQGASPPWNVLAFFVVARVMLSGICLKLAMALMQRPATDPGRHLKRALTAMDRFFLHLVGSRKWVLWKSGLGECRGNPIYWRERAISVVGQRDHMIRMLYGSGLILCIVLGAALRVGWTHGGITLAVIGIVGVPLLLAGLLMLVQPALAFAREKERGGLAALVPTPMTPRQFVMGKYLYALRSVAAPLGVGIGFGFLTAHYGSDSGIENEVWSLATVVLTVPLAVAVILYVAAGAQNAVGGILGGVAALVGFALVIVGLVRYEGLIYRSYRAPGSSMVPGDYSADIGCCAFLLLLCSVLAAPFSKWMRNGLVIALFALVPALLGDIAREMLPSSMMLAIPVALAVYLGIRLKKLHVALVPAGAALPLFLLRPRGFGHSSPLWMLGAVISFCAIIGVFMGTVLVRRRIAFWTGAVIPAVVALIYAEGGRFPFYFLCLMLLLAYWRATRYADAGVFNRAFVAVALVGAGASLLVAPFAFARGYGFFGLIVLIGTGVIVFLSFTVRQFNQLVERNG